MNLAWNLIDALATHFFKRGQNIYTGGQPIDTAGGNLNLGAGNLVTTGLVDGVDVSALSASHNSLGSSYTAHIANPNAHHAQQHALDGGDHTGTLSWAKVSKVGSSLADLATRAHSDLTGIGANDHHAQQHALDGGDHTGTLSWAKVGKTGSSLADLATRAHSDLTGLVTGDPHSVYFLKTAFSSSPGASADVPLKTGAGGALALGGDLTVDGTTLVVDSSNNRVGVAKASPGATLHVGGNAVGDGSFSAANGMRIGGTGGVSSSVLLIASGTAPAGASGFATFGYDAGGVYVIKGAGSKIYIA